MVDWIGKTRTRNTFKWVSYIPIDSSPIPSIWEKAIMEMDYVITYSKFGEKVIKEQVPKIRNPVSMIYHGVDTRQFYSEDKQIVRERNEIDKDLFVLLYVGVNSDRKQVPRLIEAFDIFSKNKEDVLLLMHTSLVHSAGRFGWFLPEVLKQYSCKDKIVFSKNANPVHGVSIDQLRTIYSIADVFVSGSMCERLWFTFFRGSSLWGT